MSIFYAASPQVQRVQRVVGKVLKIDRPIGRRVLKFDGPTGRGLWYRPAGDEFYNSASQNGKPNNRASPDGNAPPIGAALRLGFKGFRKFKRFRGCGIALRAMSFRISLREMENQTTGLRPLEMHPFWCCAPLPPEGEVCSMLNINLIRCEQHFGD